MKHECSIAVALLAVCMGLAGPAIGTESGQMLAPGVISSPYNETSAAFTPDGREIYFTRGDFVSSVTTILVADRDAGGGYGNVRVAPFSGIWKDSEPHVSPDGKRLYFVSNRPAVEGVTPPLVANFNGQTVPGVNLWYVERDGKVWGAPVRIQGEINRVPLIFNPSVAASGNLYFSAHREDSGTAYQIYMAPRAGEAFRPPQRLDLGKGVQANRMDPAIDPQERVLLFAGNEGDSLGAADIYIVFRTPNGGWGTPINLGDDVNSRFLENAPTLGLRFGEIYVTSMRPDNFTNPTMMPRDMAEIQRMLEMPGNGSRNLWRHDISALLRAHGIDAQ